MTLAPNPTSWRRIVVRLVAVVVILNLVVWLANVFARDGAVSGPQGSTYVTTGQGSAAVAGMLERLDVAVTRSRRPMDEFGLDPAITLVLIDVNQTEYSASELRSIDRFIRDGGRLVVVGAAGLAERLLADPPVWRSEGTSTATPVGPLAERPGLGPVSLSGFGSLDPGPDDTSTLASGDLVVAIERNVGKGSFVWLADSGPFHNDRIGQAPAAHLAVALVGVDSPVVFDEFHHGYSDQAGFWQLMSPRWRLAVILGSITGVIALVAYGRRFGPPHDLRRRLPPGRERYLEAVAGMLGRANANDQAIEAIRAEARRRLRLRHYESAAAAADELGFDAEEVEALDGDAHDDDTLVRADRALAALMEDRQ